MVSPQPLPHGSLGMGPHCLDSTAGARESKPVLRNGQFIWKARRLGYFMDG